MKNSMQRTPVEGLDSFFGVAQNDSRLDCEKVGTLVKFSEERAIQFKSEWCFITGLLCLPEQTLRPEQTCQIDYHLIINK